MVLLLAAIVPLAAMQAGKDGNLRSWLTKAAPNNPSTRENDQPAGIERVPGTSNELRLTEEVNRRFGVQTSVAQLATEGRQLHLAGSLAFDSEHYVSVRARFPGEVVELANMPADWSADRPLRTTQRPLRFGDRVTKGQLLAVVWSTELGKQKSELVDALSQLAVDQKQLETLDELYKNASASMAQLRNAQRAVETDLNRVAAAERTLRTWRVPEEEIKGVRDEARRMIANQGRRELEKERSWPRVEVRAPIDGTIVEKSVGLHTMVDTNTDLFRIADLRSLTVWAHAYEEDLPALLALKPEERRWQVRIAADPASKPIDGTMDVIGYLIDPNQHTALIMGQIPNDDDRLRAGQFVTATVTLPPPSNQVIVPPSAIVEDGRESIVFVQPDASKPIYALRRVEVAHRESQAVYLRMAPSGPMFASVQPGERVVTRGALELKAAIDDLPGTTKE